MSTREDWLVQAAQRIYDEVISPIAVIPPNQCWTVSCGFPSRNALSNSRRRVGECWPAAASGDGKTRHIFISPLLSELVDGVGYGVLPALAHELVHVVSAGKGHRGEFRRIALAIGMEGKMASSVAGNVLCQKLNAIARQLGPYPHVGMDVQGRERKQSTRMLKLVAVKCCCYTVRTTKMWLSNVGPPRCTHGSLMEEVP